MTILDKSLRRNWMSSSGNT